MFVEQDSYCSRMMRGPSGPDFNPTEHLWDTFRLRELSILWHHKKLWETLSNHAGVTRLIGLYTNLWGPCQPEGTMWSQNRKNTEIRWHFSNIQLFTQILKLIWSFVMRRIVHNSEQMQNRSILTAWSQTFGPHCMKWQDGLQQHFLRSPGLLSTLTHAFWKMSFSAPNVITQSTPLKAL